MGCSILLHLAPDRTAAVRVVPLALAWGGLALWLAPRLPDPGARGLLLAALCVRAPLVGSPLHLSDDLNRYLWEGLALAAGHDVFREAPASISGLDDALARLVNHPELPSVYPLLALAWFRLLALFGTPAAVQALTALVDATVPASIHLTTRRAAPAWAYALHPLPVIESAAGGHIDVIAVALAAAALALWQRGRSDAAWGAVLAGALVKLFPGILAPVLLRSAPRGRRPLWILLALGAALAAVLPLWPGPGEPLIPPGIAAYSGRWSFNGLLFPWLEPWLGAAARPLLVAAAGAVTLGVWARVRDPAAAWAAIGLTFLCTSPTIHPWYALWALVPGLATGRLAAAWGVLPLLGSYTVLWAYDPETGAWSEAPWLWWITWPTAAVLFAAASWSERRRDAPASEESPTAP